MKRTISILFVLLCLCANTLYGSDITKPLAELKTPDTMVIVNDRLYISELTTIYIYSLKDFKLVTKCGKGGFGSGEFAIAPNNGFYLKLFPLKDMMLVNSMGKISYYSFDGNYLSEQKVPPYLTLLKVGAGFVSSGITYDANKQMVFNVSLYDAKMKMVKELYQSTQTVGKNGSMSFPYETIAYPVYDNQIFIISSGDFTIDVFDENGKKYAISKEYERLAVENAYKDSTMKWLKDESPYKQYFAYLKDSVKFKSHYPALKDIFVTDNKIFCLTYKTKNDLNELVIMDLKGNEPRTVYVPLAETKPFQPFLYAFSNGKYFTLVKDQKTETWSLLIQTI